MGGTAAPETFNNLVINNTSSTGLTFNKTGKVTNKLTLTDGIIYTSTSKLLVLTDGAYAQKGTSTAEYKLGGSAVSYIDGPVKKIGGISTAITTYDNYHSFIFPIGKNGKWAPVLLSHFSNSAATDEFTAEYFNAGYGDYDVLSPLNHVSSVEWWDIKQDVGNSTKKIYLYSKDLGFSGINNISDENLVIAHYKSSAGSWESCGRTTSVCDFIESDSWSDFTSPFTFGSKNSNDPLPISLLKFNVACENNKVDLTWSTATETNNDYFTIQRSANASDWEFVKNIPGGGNSNSTLYYSTTDTNPLNGTSYYRLKQTDYNGQSETFSPVMVICGGSQDRQSISYYPNPFTSEVMVDLRNITFEKAVLTMYNLLGEKVYEMPLSGNESFNQEVKLDLHRLPAGVYTVSFSSEGYSNTSKIVKN
jgi:hypothetical protein